MNRGFVSTSVVCILLVGLAVGTGAALATSAGSASETVFAQEDVDPDDILMEIDVEDDGDAAWKIEYRMRLETEEDEQAFADLQEDIESDPEAYVERFRDRMESTAESASESTGREMAITDVGVEAEKEEIPRERGVVTYTFRWSNFAAVDGDRLHVGDAIDGLFLDEDTALIVRWSGVYELVSASPTPSETRELSVVYDGPTNFGSGEPRLELGPPGAATPAETDRVLPFSPVVAAALAMLLLALIGGGAFVAVRRRNDEPGGEDSESDGTDEPTADGEAAGSATGTAGDVPDSELLSNEEQVLQLIEQRGGRMKQKEVAEQLEWTDAKTSQVTKKLREEGDLEGFRLGRENVLALPEEDDGEL